MILPRFILSDESDYTEAFIHFTNGVTNLSRQALENHAPLPPSPPPSLVTRTERG